MLLAETQKKVVKMETNNTTSPLLKVTKPVTQLKLLLILILILIL